MSNGTGLDVIAVHEAGHLLAGWTFGLQIRGAHTVRTSQSYGVSYLAEGDKAAAPLDVAVVQVSGSLAERMLWGRPELERFSWMGQDHDATYARLFTTRGPILYRRGSSSS